MSNQENQNNTSFLIFGENGSGKSTISRVLKEKRDAVKNSEIYNVKDKNGERIAVKFLEETGIVITETGKAKKEEWFFFGHDFKVDFSDSRSMFISDDEEVSEKENVADVRYEIEFEKTNLEVLARGLARYGGSNKHPEGSIARRINRDFGKNSATFDRVRKEQFNAKGVEVFLKDVVEILSGSEFNDAQNRTKELIEKYLRENGVDLGRRLDEYDKKLSGLNNKLQEVVKNKNEKINYKRVLEKLNSDIALVFFDRNRLKLNFNAEKEQFEVKVRGELVDVLNNLSTAEKNIISICWYLLMVSQHTESTKKVRVFLDDPISSTDSQNKIGIYCYLKYIMNKLIEEKDSVSFVFFTHDMEVCNNIKQLFSDIYSGKYKTLMLKNKTFENLTKINYYSALMNDIYKFARGEAEELSPYIGNIMRRVVEAYATFNYAMGFIEFFKKEEILDKIKDIKIKENAESNMLKLVLHGESHEEEKVKRMEGSYTRTYSSEEKKVLAKQVLQFLYSLDNYHLQRHLIKYKNESQKDDDFLNELKVFLT